MADHFRGDYVASECPTLFNVISDPESHSSNKVMRFELHQVPDIMNPIVVKKQWSTYEDYMKEHPHETVMQARKCKTSKHCPNSVRLSKDPRMEVGQYALRLAPVFLCHRMWKYDPVRKLMTCKVPLRCFYSTINSFTARKFLTANDDLDKNGVKKHRKGTNPNGTVSDELLHLYENNIAKLLEKPRVRLSGVIPLTLLAQSASLVVELAQFSPMLEHGQAVSISKLPKGARMDLCRNVVFRGDGCNDGFLGMTIFNTPNNDLYYNLPPSMSAMEINRFPTLEIPNALSWLLLRALYKHGPRNAEKVPLFRRYLYEGKEQALLVRCFKQYKKLASQGTAKQEDEPALLSASAPTSPHPPGLFDLDSNTSDSSSTGSSGSVPDIDDDGDDHRTNASSGGGGGSYAAVAKTPLPKVAPISLKVQNAMNYMNLYAAYRPLNIKRFATMVGSMPRLKQTEDASQCKQEAAYVDAEKNLIVAKCQIKSSFYANSKTVIETEYTRVTLTTGASYWAVSSATLCISPGLWGSFYGTNAPLPTSDSTGECACGDSTCYPSNFMEFEEGVEYVRKHRDTW